MCPGLELCVTRAVTVCAQVAAFANASHADGSCEGVDPGGDSPEGGGVDPEGEEGGGVDPAQRWRCLFGEYRLPLLRTPYMLLASQVS